MEFNDKDLEPMRKQIEGLGQSEIAEKLGQRFKQVLKESIEAHVGRLVNALEKDNEGGYAVGRQGAKVFTDVVHPALIDLNTLIAFYLKGAVREVPREKHGLVLQSRLEKYEHDFRVGFAQGILLEAALREFMENHNKHLIEFVRSMKGRERIPSELELELPGRLDSVIEELLNEITRLFRSCVDIFESTGHPQR